MILMDSACLDEGCGEISRAPAEFSKNRHFSHDVDTGKLIYLLGTRTLKNRRTIIYGHGHYFFAEKDSDF